MKALLATAAMIASTLYMGSAAAAPMPIIDAMSAKILGIRNLPIADRLFDIDFVDGSCNTLFNDCDPDEFFIRTVDLGFAAADAIVAALGDRDPQEIAGCESTERCDIFIPFQIAPSDPSFLFAGDAVFSAGLDFGGNAALPVSFDTASDSTSVYAVLSDIPAPPSALLFLFGIAIAAGARVRASGNRIEGSVS